MACAVVAPLRIHSNSSDKQIMQDHSGVNTGVTIFHSNFPAISPYVELLCNLRSIHVEETGVKKKITEPKGRYVPISFK